MENQITTKIGITEYIASDGRRFNYEYSCKKYQNVLNIKSAPEKIKKSKNVIYHENLKYKIPPFFFDSCLDIDEYINIDHCYYFTPVNADGIIELNCCLKTIIDSNNKYLNKRLTQQDLIEEDINKMIFISFNEDLELIEARGVDSVKEEFQCYLNCLSAK